MELLLFFLPIIYLLFIIIAPFFIIWGGLKIFKIQGISTFKIIVYLIIGIPLFFLVEKVLHPLIGGISGHFSNYFFLQIIDNLIYSVVSFLMLKYYFHLSGKKLWQFFIYLLVAALVFSVFISLPAFPI